MKSTALASGGALSCATYLSISERIAQVIKYQDILIAKHIEANSHFWETLSDKSQIESQKASNELRAVCAELGVLYDLRRSERLAVQSV